MQPPLACDNCRRRKRKCDKVYPVCSNCLKNSTRCNYRAFGQLNSAAERVQSQPISTQAPWSNPHETSFLITAAFLDHAFFDSIVSADQKQSGSLVHAELRSLVPSNDDLQAIITDFVSTIDPMIPFIPTPCIARLRSEVCPLSGEELLLISCMKLLARPVTEESPSTESYLRIRSAVLNVEVYGAVTFQFLQTLVVLFFYEYGHGIHPNAFNTLGMCVRYLASLGIYGPESDQIQPRDEWIDVETRRRLWWAIFVLERGLSYTTALTERAKWPRYTSLRRPLVGIGEGTAHPVQKLYEDLMTDIAEQRTSSSVNLTLAECQVEPNIGQFRLLVYSAYALSRAMSHIVSPSQEQESTTEIYESICLLLNVLETGRHNINVPIGVSRSICNSAIFLLYSNVTDREKADPRRNEALIVHPCSLSAEVFLNRSRLYFEGGLGILEKVSPFLHHWGYQAYKHYYLMYQQEGGEENEKALTDISKVLYLYSNRWKLGTSYLALLHANQSPEN